MTGAHAAFHQHVTSTPYLMEKIQMATAKKAPAKPAAAKKAAPAKKAAVAAKAPAKKAAAKTAAPAVKRTANAAFMKAVTPSPQLAAIIGATPMPRTEVTKKLWEYIKAHKLQDAAKKTNINADAKLKEIFKKPQVTMFEMTKLVSAHLS
jgi:chromatin remodeling complex protein RSC6